MVDGYISITMIFDAPPETVWKAWTEPERVKHWWGPKGFTAAVSKLDFRVGGTYLYCMRSPDGQDFWSTGEYREIIKNQRIVATDNFADEEGNIVPASHYGMSGKWPLELLVTLKFQEQDGRTRFTLQHEGIPSGENRDLAEEGWRESLKKLAEYLKTEK